MLVPELNRRNVMLTFGIGALAAAIATPQAGAYPSRRLPPPTAPAPGTRTGSYLFHDEFGGGDPAAGSYPAEMLIDWVRVF